MKKIINKIQDLGQKAAHLKQVVEAAPAKAAQLRESVLMTAGQLQQLRRDVQSSVTGLRADNEEHLVRALHEINDSAETFLEAGYELTGVDMELSPAQRLMVHLEKRESVSESTIRSLLSANSGRQTIYALVAALAKADGLSEKLKLSHLDYRELVLHVGPTPSVRLCWRADAEPGEAGGQSHTVPAAAVSAIPAPAPPAPLPMFSQSSYFEQRSTPPPKPASVPDAIESPASPAPVAGVASPVGAPQPPPGSDWKSSALDRFKKMPDASKYRR